MAVRGVGRHHLLVSTGKAKVLHWKEIKIEGAGESITRDITITAIITMVPLPLIRSAGLLPRSTTQQIENPPKVQRAFLVCGRSSPVPVLQRSSLAHHLEAERRRKKKRERRRGKREKASTLRAGLTFLKLRKLYHGMQVTQVYSLEPALRVQDSFHALKCVNHSYLSQD